MLPRRGDKATNPAAAITGEKTTPVLLRIAEFNFNTRRKEKRNRVTPNTQLYEKALGEYEYVRRQN